MFKSDQWLPIFGVMTNMGLFRCNRDTPLEILPKIMRLHMLRLEPLKGTYSGRRYCFKLEYINDKEKQSEKIFSVDDQETYNIWLRKIKKTLDDYRSLGNSILLPPAALKNSEIDVSQMLGSTATGQTRRVAQTPVSRLATKLTFK